MSLSGKIVFPNHISHIIAGDDINLIIEIENEEKLFVKEIYLNFLGLVNVQWEDLMNKNKDGEIIYFMQQFEDQQILLSRQVSVQGMDVLSKGNFLYNVILKIPQHLPESVSRKYGSIKYELHLIANYPAGVKILYKMPLDIKGYFNVCDYMEYTRPFHTIFKKSLCWDICNFEPLKIVLTLPHTTFIPGDAIDYLIKIEHFKKLLDLQRLSIILIQMQHYKAFKPKEKIKNIHTTLSQTIHLFDEYHHNSKVKGSIKLPLSLVPTSTMPCLLKTSYKIRFILVFVGLTTDGYITVPIKIGSHRQATEKINDFKKCDDTVLQIEQNEIYEYEI